MAQINSAAIKVMSQQQQRGQKALVISDELQSAVKAMPYSQYVQDFINDNGGFGDLYTEQQVEMAYRTSVYMFSAQRRVANLFSKLKIMGEVDRGDGQWERLPETHDINKIFAQAGSRFLFQYYMFYSTYGKVLVYKRKTRKAAESQASGRLLWRYMDGAISGIHIVPNSHWTMREDVYTNTILGFDLSERSEDTDKQVSFDRKEVVYSHDFDPRYVNGAVSMASLVLNQAITNAAVARWAAHYFMSGAMPLLLVSTEDDPSVQQEADLTQYKNLVQRAWRGLFGDFSLRALFTDRKLSVQEAGITADRVTAPDLNRDALNAIASVFQIAPDLIVPPEGGSDNARHRFLIKQAYDDAVTPVGEQALTDFNEDFGLSTDDSKYRLVLVTDHIPAMEADRGDRADTEIQIFQGGIQSYGQTQERLDIEPIEPLKDFIYIEGRLRSVQGIVDEDRMKPDRIVANAVQGWNDGWVKRSEIREMLNLTTAKAEKDGYKYELVPEPGGGGFGGGPDNSGGPAPVTPAPSLPSPPKPGLPHEDEADQSTPTPNENVGSGGETTAPQAVETRASVTVEAEAKPEVQATITSDRELTVTQGNQITILEPPESTALDVDEFAPPEGAVVLGEEVTLDPLYISAWLGEDSLLKTIRERLQATMIGPGDWDWVDPDTWHLTLTYAPHCKEDIASRLLEELPESLSSLQLRAYGLVFFDTSEGLCMALAIERDAQLDTLQNKMRVLLDSHMVEQSPHATPEYWIPHVTLAYGPYDAEPPDMLMNFVLVPEAVTITRDEYNEIARIPVAKDWRDALGDHDEPDGAEDYDPNAINERTEFARQTDDWRSITRSRLRDWMTSGEAHALLPSNLQEHVSDCLQAGWKDKDVMEAGFRAIRDGRYDPSAQTPDNPLLPILNKREDKAMQNTASEELETWAKYAKKNGAAKAQGRFEIQLLPLKIEQDVRAALATAESDDQVQAIFSDARKALDEMTEVAATDEDALLEWAERMTALGQGFEDLVDIDEDAV